MGSLIDQYEQAKESEGKEAGAEGSTEKGQKEASEEGADAAKAEEGGERKESGNVGRSDEGKGDEGSSEQSDEEKAASEKALAAQSDEDAREAAKADEGADDEDSNDYKQELESYMTDPILKELLELKKQGKSITKELLRDGFEDFDAVDVENLNTAKHWAKEALIASGLNAREADITLKKQFKLVGQLDDDLTEDEIEDREYQEVQLKRAAKEFLSKKKEGQLRLRDIDTTSTSKDEVEKEVARRFNDSVQKNSELIKKIATNVTEKVTKVDYEAVYKNEDGNEVKVPYQVEITADMKKQARKELQDPVFFNYVLKSVNKSATPQEQEVQLMSSAVKLMFPELNDQLRLSKAVNAAQKEWYDNDLTHRSKPLQNGSSNRGESIDVKGKSNFAKEYAKHAAKQQ